MEIKEVKRGEVVLPTGVRLSFFGWEIDLGLSDSWYSARDAPLFCLEGLV